MTSPLHGIEEDVPFDHAAADALRTACNQAASAIEGQAGSRASWVAHGLEDFQGYYSQLFQQNGTTQAGDASLLVTRLREVATAVGDLKASATAEQQRRVTAREWKRRQDDRNVVDHVVDWFTGGEEPPVGPPDPAPTLVISTPPAPQREPLSGSGGTGTSSARPGHLRTFATNSAGANDSLAPEPGKLRAAYATFGSTCTWGSLSADGVWTGFDRYLTANGNDVHWANTVAAAFEAAGSDGTVTVTNASITASLQAAGVNAQRRDLVIDPPQAFGAQPTTGYSVDPVNTATGNFLEPECDLGFVGGGSALAFTRMYNSLDPSVGAFGPGWSSWTECGLRLTDEDARWRLADGREIVFPRLGQGWDRATTEAFWLDAAGPGHVVTDNAGGRWEFAGTGELVHLDRGRGTGVDLHWEGGRLTRMTHERGRWLALEWAGEGEAARVVGLVASDGRRVEHGYEDGRLVAVTADGGTRRYTWNAAGLVAQVIDADGVVEADNEYDDRGRVTVQRTQHGRVVRFAYLPGRVTVVSDPDGSRSNTWIHDDRGRLVGIIDSDDRRASTAYDRYGNVVMATSRDGRVVLAEFDDRGHRTARVTRGGARVDTRYDDRDRPVEVVVDGDGDPSVIRYGYDGDDRNPSTVTDGEGGVTRLDWDGNLLLRATDPTGVRLEYGYDAAGDVVSITNALGGRARLERDAIGRVVAAISPAGHRTTYRYDERGALAERTDPDGGTWRMEYTAAGRLAATVDPYGARTQISHSETGSGTVTTDPLGRSITRGFDDLGNLSAVTLPDGSRWEYAHDALSRLVAITDPDGATWQHEYDVNGAPIRTIDPTGRVRTQAHDLDTRTVRLGDAGPDGTPTALDTDRLGRIVSVTTPDGASFLTRYDRCARPVEYVDAAGAVTSLERDAAGRIVRLRRPDGITTEYRYDELGKLAAVDDSDGRRTTFEYDADGRVVAELGPAGATRYEYDACGRTTAVTRPGHGRATWTYDLAGRTIAIRDRLWGTRRFTWDAAGQLVAARNALGGVTHYRYDDLGRAVEITDPLGNTTRRRFNAHHKLVEQVDPLGRTLRAGYDAAGRQVWQEEADGVRLTWTHDEWGEVAAVGVDGRTVAAFAQDPTERRLVVHDTTDPDREHTLEVVWDARRRLVERTRDGRGVRWTRDRLGRCTDRLVPDGARTHYDRDAAGRLVGVDAGPAGGLVVARDAAGRVVRAAGGGVTQEWRHADGEVVGHTLVAGPLTIETVVERDDEGRVAALVRDGVRTEYAYDAAGQLLSARTGDQARTWSYDAAGRLVAETDGEAATTYEYDAAGQLVARHGASGTTRYRYTPTGRRAGAEGPGGNTTYSWSPLGWLTGVSGPDGSASLHVDALGQLARIDDAEVFWDGSVPAQVGGTSVVDGPGMTAVGDRWQATGWRGVRADADDPWATLPGIGVGFGASVGPGGSVAVADLEWLTARAYDPATRGFLSRDPLEPVTGAPWAGNPYSYAGNDPLHAVDPTGLRPATDTDIQTHISANQGAFAAVGNWARDNWEYLAGAGMILVGGALVAFGGPVGGLIGGSMIGAGIDTIVQKATTGTVAWDQVAVGFAVGLIPFGGLTTRAGTTVVRSVAQRAGVTGIRATVVNGAVGGFAGGFVTGNYAYFTGDGPHTVSNYVQTVGLNTVVSTGTGVVSQGISDGITAWRAGSWPNGAPPTTASAPAAEVPAVPSVEAPPSSARFVVDPDGVVTDLEAARFVVDPSGVVTDREAARFVVDTAGNVVDTSG